MNEATGSEKFGLGPQFEMKGDGLMGWTVLNRTGTLPGLLHCLRNFLLTNVSAEAEQDPHALVVIRAEYGHEWRKKLWEKVIELQSNAFSGLLILLSLELNHNLPPLFLLVNHVHTGFMHNTYEEPRRVIFTTLKISIRGIPGNRLRKSYSIYLRNLPMKW